MPYSLSWLWYYGLLQLMMGYCTAYFHISQPEKPLSLQLDLCSHHMKPVVEHEMLYLPDDARLCARIFSDRNLIDLEHDRHHTTMLKPTVTIAWSQMNSNATCKLNFKGYRGEYRIAPDLGNYGECQRPLSAYIAQMANGNTPKWNTSTNSDCPIEQLPFSYADYLACEIKPNYWYRLKFSTVKLYETFHHKTYRQFRSNHSSVFYFYPRNQLSMSGDRRKWLKQLFHIRTRRTSCDTFRYLIALDITWPLQIQKIIGYYQMRSSSAVYLTQTLFNTSNGDEQWFTGEFVVMPTDDVHELCVEILPESIVFCESLLVAPEDCAIDSDNFSSSSCSTWSSSMGSVMVSLSLLIALLVHCLLSLADRDGDSGGGGGHWS